METQTTEKPSLQLAKEWFNRALSTGNTSIQDKALQKAIEHEQDGIAKGEKWGETVPWN